MANGLVNGYSSTVKLSLEVDGETLSVAQVGDGTLILREPRDISASSRARLIISVDGRVTAKQIILPHGSSKDAVLVEYLSVPNSSS